MLVFVCLSLPAFGQLSTGTISGTVMDASGAVIPGVTVMLSSPGVIGGNQQATTNERGVYQFNRLIPRTYMVRAELPGFKAAVHENIAVNADVTVRVDMKLEVGEIADTVTVTGEAPLLDTSSALNQAVLDRATLDKLPTGHDLWSIGRTVPGVVVTTFDVGGNQSFQQYTPTAHGSSGSDNKYAIDGLDVAWAGGAGTVMVYFDPNMFEEINYQVGNISAENRQGGVVMNMVTKTGTNDFHGSFMFTGTKGSLMSDNISPDLRSKLIRQVPAAVLAANPNIRPGQQILSLFDTAASLSGPVVRDKFWFTATYKISSLNQYILGAYNPNGTQGLDDNRITNGTLKLSYQLTDASQLHYTYSRNLKYRFHRRTTAFSEDAASRFQDQWADIYQLKWTSTVSSRIVTDAGVSLQTGPSPYLPKPEAEAAAARGLFPRTDQATNALTVMNQSYSSQPQYRVSSNFNLSYFAGAHEIKTGYQFNRIMLRSQNWSIVDPVKAPLPGPFSARYNNGIGNQVTLYNYPT
ncbi:MAG: TonB-dependent receptor, partial [Acidobacteria bacterium]|nr:TonB-dependent receptor [Acidobacteriota bacterium]